jgi:hypothetical protein
MVLIDAIGYILAETVTNKVPIAVLALHPLNLTIINGCVFIKSDPVVKF